MTTKWEVQTSLVWFSDDTSSVAVVVGAVGHKREVSKSVARAYAQATLDFQYDGSAYTFRIFEYLGNGTVGGYSADTYSVIREWAS